MCCLRAYATSQRLRLYHTGKRTENKAALICLGCSTRGCTSHDHKLYTCQQCDGQLGRKCFDWKQLDHFLERGSRLICKPCTEGTKHRLQDLAVKVRRSTVRCKCFRPVHREKCPLAGTQFGGRRWPGMDTGVQEDDVRFLNVHNPTWWRKRLGKP